MDCFAVTKEKNVGLEVFIAVVIKSTIFWDIKSCKFVPVLY
jgi:hypothetical protein